MTITYTEHLKHQEEFRKYLDVMEIGSEFEQTIHNLFNFTNISYTSEEFQQALFKECKNQLDWFNNHTTIVQEEPRVETVTIPGGAYIQYNDY